MSLAAQTRAAVRESPLLLEALRTGIVNYAAAARALDIDGDIDAITAALRRFAADLEPREPGPRDARVTMHGGLERAPEGLLVVGGTGFAENDGELTGIMARGEIDANAVEHVLGVLRVYEVPVIAAGFSDDGLAVVVDRRDGAETLRRVEAALESVPG